MSNERWDEIWVDVDLATMVEGGGAYGVVRDGAIGVSDGRLTFVGPRTGLPGPPESLARQTRSGGHRWVTPGLIDCHTHTWTDPSQLGRDAAAYIARQGGCEEVSAGPADHELASRCTDKTLVFGYRSLQLGAEVPNDAIADYVARNADRMIGVAAVDPTEDGAAEKAAARRRSPPKTRRRTAARISAPWPDACSTAASATK